MKKLFNRVFFLFNLHKSIPLVLEFFTSKEVTSNKKLLFGGIAAGYALFPIDMIPDFFPLLGVMDDVTVMAILLDQMKKHMPDDSKKEK